MSNTAFAHICPGCFADKGSASACPNCGYDDNQKRGPLVLPHRTLLNNGQYLIGKVLGKPGGFGITYLAFDTKLETKVAIKEYLPRDLAGRDGDHATISAHSADDAEHFRYGLTQFLQEARTLARFDHANIVRVRNFFEENGTGYLVMDYYDGITLADYLAQQPQGKLPEQTAVDILMPILDGLREVHAQNFLHRDIKPQNIYLTTGNRAILLDFGAARQAMSERSRSLSVMVSEGYAPYEQYHRRGEQGPWTDIYASAAVLYHAVAGEPPPPATERISKDELNLGALGVSVSLANALRLGLAVDHKNRPQTMAAFQRMLIGSHLPSDLKVAEHESRLQELSNATKTINSIVPIREKKASHIVVLWALVPTVIILIALVLITSELNKKQDKNVATAQSNIVIPAPPPATPAFNNNDEDLIWFQSQKTGQRKYLDYYVKQYPDGKYFELAMIQIKKLDELDQVQRTSDEEIAWSNADRVNTEAAYLQYQSLYPQGLHSGQADSKLRQLADETAIQAETQQWQQAQSASDSATVQAYLNRYPAGRYTVQAQTFLANLKKINEYYSTVGNYPITDCVKGKSTGLTWEGKPTSGERSSSNEYTNFGDGRSGDASAFVNIVNAMRLCGYSDWRLPSKDELLDLVVKGVSPTIDSNWFPNTQTGWYWTSSPYAGNASYAWYVDFSYGDVSNGYRPSDVFLRLVR